MSAPTPAPSISWDQMESATRSRRARGGRTPSTLRRCSGSHGGSGPTTIRGSPTCSPCPSPTSWPAMTPVDDDPPRHCGALYGMLAFVVVAVGGGAAGWVIGWIMDRLSR